MGYLGYDPERLLRLRAFLETLAAERARTRFDDPLSQLAADAYGRASSGVLATCDRIDAIIGCGLDAAFRPVALDVTLAVVDVIRLDDPAWTTVTDPGTIHIDPLLGAVHLAEYVAATGMADAFDPKTSAELLSRLHAVAADPNTAAAFIATLGYDDLAALVERLWTAMATPYADDERRRANDAVAALASIIGRVERAQPGAWAAYVDRALGDEHRSIAAVALMVRGAELPPAALGPTFTRLAAAAMARPEPAVYGADGTVLWSTAQALSDALAKQPSTANAVVASLDAATFAWLLITTNASCTGPLLWAATSPFAHGPSEAEAAVSNLLVRVAGAHRLIAPDLRGWLGAVVAPWVNPLGALRRPSSAAHWAVASDPVAIEAMRWILASTDAADLVTRWLVTNTPAAVRDVLAAGPPTDERVFAWAEQLGLTAGRMKDEQLDDARRRLDAWRNGWRLPLAATNTAVVHLFDIGVVAQFIATQIMVAGEGRALDGVAAHEALGAPPPIASVTVDEVRRSELIEATLIVSARRTVFDQLIAAGRIPAGSEPPPVLDVTSSNPVEDDITAVDDWKNRSIGEIGADAVLAVTDVGDATRSGFAQGLGQAEHDPRH